MKFFIRACPLHAPIGRGNCNNWEKVDGTIQAYTIVIYRLKKPRRT